MARPALPNGRATDTGSLIAGRTHLKRYIGVFSSRHQLRIFTPCVRFSPPFTPYLSEANTMQTMFCGPGSKAGANWFPLVEG